jgi:hypothetical protein
VKIKLISGAIIASMLMIGCGDSDKSPRFSTITNKNDVIRVDNVRKLEWVGSSGDEACKPHSAATTETEDLVSAKIHCEVLVFGGHDDWRVPTAKENVDFILGMKKAGLTPFYANPKCPRVIGLSSEGSSALAVNTHNSKPIGIITPWEVLLTQDPNNFGVKCVRNQ